MIEEIINEQILKDIIDYEVEKDRIVRSQYQPDQLDLMEREARIENLLHLSNLIGANLTLTTVKSIYLGRKLSLGEEENKLIKLLINSRRAEEYISSIIDSRDILMDRNFLIHLNKLVLTGIKETWEIELRTGKEEQDALEDIFNKGSAIPDLNPNLDKLFGWYDQNRNQLYSQVVVFTMLFQLLYLRPWKIGNNITSLLIYDYLFKKYKLDGGGLITSLGLIDEYKEDLIRTFQYVALNQDKIDLWIKKLISLNARYIREKRLEIEHKLDEMKKVGSERSNLLDLNKRQLKILRYLQNVPQVKREDYVHMMSVSTMTAYRDLQGLVDKDLLKVYGQGRGTKYSLVNK